MIYVGIDVAKDKHDCFITNSDGEVLFKSFTIPNNREGFESLFQKVQSVSDDLTKVKVGLEATGHYSYNLLGLPPLYVPPATLPPLLELFVLLMLIHLLSISYAWLLFAQRSFIFGERIDGRGWSEYFLKWIAFHGDPPFCRIFKRNNDSFSGKS